MDKLKKFLKRLTREERDSLAAIILPKIFSLELDGLDVKKLRGLPLWRVRSGKIRIIFSKQNNSGVIVKIALRKDAYKDL